MAAFSYQPQKAEGWMCYECGKRSGKVAIHCQFCGKRWEEVFWGDSWDQRAPSITRPPRQPKQPWNRSLSDRAPRASGWGDEPKKKKKDKREKEKKKPKEGQDDPGFSPFGTCPQGSLVPPFQASPSMTPFPSSNTASSNVQAVNQDLVKELLKCYPDAGSMPQHIKDLVEKATTDSAKALTKAMHNATSALGRAKKSHQELVETKKIHRQNWLRHLESSAALWNQQLAEYRKKQSELQASVAKAASDVESARRQILTLGSKDASMAFQAPEEEEEPVVEPNADLEEETSRVQLQKTLEACAASTGPPPAEPIDLEKEGAAGPSMPAENPQKKRALSAEPPAESLLKSA